MNSSHFFFFNAGCGYAEWAKRCATLFRQKATHRSGMQLASGYLVDFCRQ